MHCLFCEKNHGEIIPATHLAPQVEGEAVNYVLVCEVHFEGWWDGSDVPEIERPATLNLADYGLAEAVLAWAEEPQNHGGNPYCHDFVKQAQRILGDG